MSLENMFSEKVRIEHYTLNKLFGAEDLAE